MFKTKKKEQKLYELRDFFARGNIFLAQQSYNENEEEIRKLFLDLIKGFSQTNKRIIYAAYTLGHFEALKGMDVFGELPDYFRRMPVPDRTSDTIEYFSF